MDESFRVRARTARAEIQAGLLRGPALLERLRVIPFVDRDVWIDEVLGIEPPPPDVADLPRGAVPYLPCGVDEIVAMVRDVPVRADHQLVDLGAGLGRVVILAHLLTNARARGIEIQEPLVRAARRCSAALRLDGVAFEHADAADEAVALDASLFFLYAPFNGGMLGRVLGRLGRVAERRPIVVCAVGMELDEPWLVERARSSRALTIFDSR